MPVIGQNNIIRVQTYSTGYNTFQSSSAQVWTTLSIGQTNYTGSRLPGNTNLCTFEKQHNNSHLKIVANFPGYLANGNVGYGYRMVISKDNSTYYNDVIDNGPAERWGAMGYGGNTAGIWRFEWDTEAIDASRSSGFLTHTGTTYFYFQFYVWTSADIYYPLSYVNTSFPKYGTMQCYEVEV
jgi:hypothetical protein